MAADSIDFTAAPEGIELIPIEKLNDYLFWGEKEFVEKYDEIRYDASQDELLKATFQIDTLPIFEASPAEL